MVEMVVIGWIMFWEVKFGQVNISDIMGGMWLFINNREFVIVIFINSIQNLLSL